MPHIRNPREDMCFRRMFGVLKWGNRASENLSYLLRVAELLGGRAGIVTRRVVASEQAGQGSSYTCTRAPHTHTHTQTCARARTHTHTYAIMFLALIVRIKRDGKSVLSCKT